MYTCTAADMAVAAARVATARRSDSVRPRSSTRLINSGTAERPWGKRRGKVTGGGSRWDRTLEWAWWGRVGKGGREAGS